MLELLWIVLAALIFTGFIFVIWVWPALICYHQAQNKNLFGHYNWASVFVGLFFGWIGAIVLIILKD